MNTLIIHSTHDFISTPKHADPYMLDEKSFQSGVKCCLKLCRIFHDAWIQRGQDLCFKDRGNARRGVDEVEGVGPSEPSERTNEFMAQRDVGQNPTTHSFQNPSFSYLANPSSSHPMQCSTAYLRSRVKMDRKRIEIE